MDTIYIHHIYLVHGMVVWELREEVLYHPLVYKQIHQGAHPHYDGHQWVHPAHNKQHQQIAETYTTYT